MFIRILNTVLIVFFCALMYGQESSIKWYPIEEAIELAQQNNKKIFIEVYTDWCKWCKRLDETTFKDEKIISMINEHFYAVKFDAEMQRPIVGPVFGHQLAGEHFFQPRAVLEPVREAIAVFMPTSCPEVLIKAPPELPGLTAASV